MWRAAVILLILICSPGCVVPRFQEPTVTVDMVGLENVKPRSLDLSLWFHHQ
ncbi:MAG TPA: hypothetical protein PKK74_01800 [Candidatus Methanoculleus thermohydrogenotrophicum]|nr:hypothetical protein [Candidatus Methanoculleus thermohydrogenotrophicum]NLM82527.1 hypothetical protein [Candidatus Methanoculleus thermohydrogenotrophicum]HOB17419.1 hypothetical protein [Candidatus Methanoculleus thermohydrogenotrophicum]HPZ37593.1 hypothetical protein [Candidatus Methanoculleus thermohydrogenotrophicum]HQC90667.1 hypothetical protein [Candidatus Methanoculleus thermohydrogenotrophicum]